MSVWYWPDRDVLILHDNDDDLFKEYICQGIYRVYTAIRNKKVKSFERLIYIGEL
jgi:hypothetical protein